MCAAISIPTRPTRGSDRAAPPGTCPSLLSSEQTDWSQESELPQCLSDLHLDDLIAATTPGPFQQAVWRRPVADVRVAEFRQDVIRDLARPEFREAAEIFAAAVASARNSIVARANAHYAVPAELNLAEAIRRYKVAVGDFSGRLSEFEPRSGGLRSLAAHLDGLVHSDRFGQLADGCEEVLAQVRSLSVELGILPGTVWVGEDAGRPACAGEVESFFSRFSSPAAGPPVAVPQRPRRYLNHVEAQAIELVANLRPEPFERLHQFVTAHADFLTNDMELLAEELRFFLGFLKVADGLGPDVEWCMPHLLPAGGGAVRIDGLVDVALALRRRSEEQPLVSNDLLLNEAERIVFITGPNQGGKTTFVRAIGLLAYLASLGLPVPARAASLPLMNPVLTHFPQPDDPVNQRGGLADELVRLHDILQATTGASLLVLNELFSATSAEDALELSELVVPQFERLGCRVLWVTFLEELVTSVDGAASLVGQVAPEDPTRPTFRFRPQPPAGRSHAAALAARHGLSSQDLAGRLR